MAFFSWPVFMVSGSNRRQDKTFIERKVPLWADSTSLEWIYVNFEIFFIIYIHAISKNYWNKWVIWTIYRQFVTIIKIIHSDARSDEGLSQGGMQYFFLNEKKSTSAVRSEVDSDSLGSLVARDGRCVRWLSLKGEFTEYRRRRINSPQRGQHNYDSIIQLWGAVE